MFVVSTHFLEEEDEFHNGSLVLLTVQIQNENILVTARRDDGWILHKMVKSDYCHFPNKKVASHPHG